jgi:hypothetical protein
MATSQLPAPPPARDWDAALPTDLGVMGNTDYGDCGFAGYGHAVQTWTSGSITPTTEQVLAAYAGCTGFDPSKPETDQGVALLNALKWFTTQGVGGHVLGAYAAVDPRDEIQVQQAISMFGGVYIGAGMPVTAQHPGPWVGPAVPGGGDQQPYSWGGHCMWVPKYDRLGVGFITWGDRQEADWQWWLDYVDEAYVLLSSDWVDGSKPAPSGFDIDGLRAALSAL